MIIHPNVLQGSDEWHAMRRGRPTASRFKDILTPSTGELSRNKKGGPSDKVANYIAELIGETFCPDWIDFAGNKFTDRGTELEPLARKAFTAHASLPVAEVGFVTRADKVAGCSPDGLIMGLNEEWAAGVELKCPAPKTHVSWIWDGVLPAEHVAQVHGSMAVTGLNRWHFFSFFPGLQPFHLVVERDDYTENVSAALDDFIAIYAEAREKLIPKLKQSKP